MSVADLLITIHGLCDGYFNVRSVSVFQLRFSVFNKNNIKT